ncbi:hypothetical protein Q3G72_000270 [Acer saccharum]|nr:hypothetical protein Q3G72_000270 [Acer saccharum]
MDDCLIFIKNNEGKLRNCYSETIKLSSNDFVEMILLDAVFLLEVLSRSSKHQFRTTDDRIFSKPNILLDVEIDIWSIENQLPLFILEHFFELAKTSMAGKHYEGLSLSQLTSRLFMPVCELLLVDSNLFEIHFSEAKHFIDLLRLCLQPSNNLDSKTEVIYSPIAPSITQLHQAGVNFKLGSTERLLDIRFSKGTLEIPMLKIGLVEELDNYCKSPWNKWKANLKQNYFNTPWASISVIAAAILLMLTFVQAVCSIIAL